MNVGPWKFIGEVPHIFRDFIMSLYLHPVFKSPDGAARMKAKILRSVSFPPPLPPQCGMSVSHTDVQAEPNCETRHL